MKNVFHEYEMLIEKSVTKTTVLHQKACLEMPNSDLDRFSTYLHLILMKYHSWSPFDITRLACGDCT